MKIEKLEFENINSLAGKFTIDFTNPALAGDGIFVITGPTGAGKTTLLDAISFALYGKTARQSGVSDTHNELMTHGCKSCMARVTFSHAGKRYAVSTEHSRTTRAQYPFQKHVNRLFEELDAEGHAVSTAKKDVTPEVVRCTGLTFANFKRCMMLAQGEFASFLKASGSDRAEVLTTITGTEIYQKIGDMVVDTYTEKERALEAEHPQETLPEASRTEHEKARDGLQRKKDELSAQADKLKEAANWLKRIGELTEKTAKAGKTLEAARKANADFIAGAEHAHLLAAERAAGVQQSFTVREEKKSALAATCDEVQHADAEVKRLTPAVQQARDNAQTAKGEMDEKSPALEAELVRIANELRPLENKIDIARRDVAKTKKDAEDAAAAYTRAKQAAEDTENDLAQAKARLAENEKKLRERTADQNLGSALPAARVHLQAWSEINGTPEDIPATAEISAELGKLLPEREELLDGCSMEQLANMRAILHYAVENSEKLQQAEHAKKQAENRVSELENMELPSLEEARAAVDGRKDIYDNINQIAGIQDKLDELYLKFKEGKLECCPCCGSATPGEHRKSVAGNELTIARQNLEAAQEEFAKRQTRHTKHNHDVDAARKELVRAQEQHTKLQAEFNSKLAMLPLEIRRKDSKIEERRLAEIIARIESISVRIDALTPLAAQAEKRDALHAELRPFTAELPNNLPAAIALCDVLGKRADEYNACQADVASLKQGLAALEATVREREAACRNAAQDCARREQLAAEAGASLNSLLETLHAQWGGESADARERRVRGDKEKLAAASRNADAELVRRQNEQKVHQQQLEAAHQRAKTQETALAAAERELAAALKEAQFADEAAFRAAAEWLPQREALANEKQRLQRDLHAAEQLLNSHRRDLEELQAGKLTDAKPEELAARLDELDGQRRLAEEDWAKEKSLLERDDDARNANKELEARLAPLQKERHYWELLKTVLGGSKESFKRYAQQITFDLLIKSANQRLARLTDRYMLKQDRSSMLGLLVVDRWQDDEKGRAASNLSGGESFIVSLALALGLAQMVGNDTQLDTLFLDEGFGTLDAEQLEKVLDALANLRADGKLIGIISHVEQLKERISQSIEITRLGNNGRSTIAPREGVDAEPAR